MASSPQSVMKQFNRAAAARRAQDGTGNLDRRNVLADNPRAEFGSGQEAQFVTHRL